MMTDFQESKFFDNPNLAVDYLVYLYKKNTETIRLSLLSNTILEEYKGTYPFVGITIEQSHLFNDPKQSHGCLWEVGVYGTTVTRPDIFYQYYLEQISLLLKNHKTPVMVGLSNVQIPLPYISEHATKELNDDLLWIIHTGFVLPNLSRINDNIANGTYKSLNQVKPLSLFDAERTDFSLHRLYHYTGTGSEHFQGFVLLTNYQRYIEAFIQYAKDQIVNNGDYIELVGPGEYVFTKQDCLDGAPFPCPDNLPQMPAYHLKRKDNLGITFINIGVGPSNAKNITDHLAVLRPHCWLMLGHCAGLRSTQALGDYVLAHAYVREDHVLDQDVPLWIPIPPLAEVQVALQQAVHNLIAHDELKERVRTGTVLTTDNRNWELKSRELYERLRQSRAIAVDMESATIAANGMRFRVPYGTLLCVSDKPIHGEIKLQGMANAFYKKRVHQHLEIGLEAIRLLRESGTEPLHSRKLRGFDDPPFR